ncbi:ketoacyl-ACP synthase III [Fodinicola feengrottensis]|uniref:Beta-ketoacyl-[acyl-carrier-protein] synthase III n=1 Tax=Fodinicola feengrottensis TaxID=435914 RepID=A0ABN2G9W2_9ACTN
MQVVQTQSYGRIVALGHYQPARVVTNDELSQRVDTNDAWIRDRVGIVSRRIAGPEETVVSMGVAAAQKALAAAGLAPTDIDTLIVASCTDLIPIPNASARVAIELGIKPAAIDINTACSGFSYALAAADHAIRAGASRNVLVIGSEKLSDVIDWEDRSTCIIFADGAGAAVVTASDTPGIGPVSWGSEPSTMIGMTERNHIYQEGQSVFRWATTGLAPIAKEICERAGVQPSELAAFVPHQANLRIIESVARKLGAANAVIARDIVESGNTSAASIPMALSKMIERGEIPSGAPVLLLGFGGGLTYAGQVVLSP